MTNQDVSLEDALKIAEKVTEWKLHDTYPGVYVGTVGTIVVSLEYYSFLPLFPFLKSNKRIINLSGTHGNQLAEYKDARVKPFYDKAEEFVEKKIKDVIFK